jgi:hypothetical protein
MTIPPAIAMHLGKIRGDSKGGWHCCCPVHGDTNPSATIRWGDNGELLMACMVCKGSMSRREYLRRLCDVTGTSCQSPGFFPRGRDHFILPPWQDSPLTSTL